MCPPDPSPWDRTRAALSGAFELERERQGSRRAQAEPDAAFTDALFARLEREIIRVLHDAAALAA